jgi:hypothetical protein
MSAQIAKQPNGLYCRYSFTSEEFTHTDMTVDAYISFCCQRAEEEAIETINSHLGNYNELLKRAQYYKYYKKLNYKTRRSNVRRVKKN